MASKKNKRMTEEQLAQHLLSLLRQVFKSDDPIVVLVRGIIVIDAELKELLHQYLHGGIEQFNGYRLGFTGKLLLARAVGILSDAEVEIIGELNRMRNIVAHKMNDNLVTGDQERLQRLFSKYKFAGVSSFLGDEASFIDQLKWSLLLLISILMQRESELKGEKAPMRAPEPDQEFWTKAQLGMAVAWGAAHFDVVLQKVVEWLTPAVQQIQRTLAQTLVDVVQQPAIPPPPRAAQPDEDSIDT